MLRNAIVAGTFDMLHSGHKALFRKALSSARLITIGVTSDGFAKRLKPRPVNSFQKRKAAIATFLGKDVRRASFYVLEDALGNSTDTTEHDAIVASPETEGKALEINRIRKRGGIYPLKVIIVQTVYSDDFKKLSSTRIASGEIDSAGRRRKPLFFMVGSGNKDKITGARLAVRKFFGPKASVFGFKAKSNVKDQPVGEETIEGALSRAKDAYLKGCDFGIGLESGLFRLGGKDYNIMWCAIFDGGTAFFGASMGFFIPEWLAEQAKAGELKKAFRGFGVNGAGGVVKFLSRGRLSRAEMGEQACSCALTSLLNRSLFEAGNSRKHLKPKRKTVVGWHGAQ